MWKMTPIRSDRLFLLFASIAIVLAGCASPTVPDVQEPTAEATIEPTSEPTDEPTEEPMDELTTEPMAEPVGPPAAQAIENQEPLITEIYTADPSAHVFEGRLYIYPSHDRDVEAVDTMEGDQYDMQDYHVFSLEDMQSPVVDHGQILHLDDVAWAEKQMWAPDAAFKNDTYYFYFPAKDEEGIFRIGVASGPSPTGPFTPEPESIPGSFSIDPAVFVDDDGEVYAYFGGLWGGQLEKWKTGRFDPDGTEPADTEPALGPRVARMAEDMMSFDGPIREIAILDQDGEPILAGDHARRFFEGAWLHKVDDTYYLSYSTGDTHFLVYATSDDPMGPFTFRGRILNPVIGWTTHHSIVEFEGQWYLFYHDSSLSGGVSHKRSVKVAEITYNDDGTIQTIDPYD